MLLKLANNRYLLIHLAKINLSISLSVLMRRPYFVPNSLMLLSLPVRHKQLESILVVTQQFHEAVEPLSEWLAATEKHLAKSEPAGTETSKLEDQISQHKVIFIILHHYHMFWMFFMIQSAMFS